MSDDDTPSDKYETPNTRTTVSNVVHDADKPDDTPLWDHATDLNATLPSPTDETVLEAITGSFNSQNSQEQTPQRSIIRTLFTSPHNMTTGTNDTQAVAAMSNVRLPPFWPEQVKLWFAQLESAFHTHKVTSEISKYHLTIPALNQTAVIEVADLIDAIPSSDPYSTLKARLIERFADSPERNIDKALNHLELGDGKPSQLFRRMRQLVGTNATDDLLRVKWLNLLPPQTRQILRIFKTHNLEELLQAADAMTETPLLPSAAAVASPEVNSVQQRTSDLADIKLLLGQLITLCRDIQASNTHQSRSRERSDNNGNRGNSYNNDSRTRSPSNRPHYRGICWFHNKHGANARKCLQPCNFAQKPEQLGKRIALLSAETPGSSTRNQVAAASVQTPHTAFFNTKQTTDKLWAENRLHVFDRNSGTRFLVDSGSIVSILPSKVSTTRSGEHPNLSAANGSTIRCHGRRLAQIDLGLRRNFIWSFVLAEISIPILGADFLSHFGLLPDLKRKRLIDEITSCSVNGQLALAQTHSISVLSPPQGLYEGSSKQFKDLIQHYFTKSLQDQGQVRGPTASVSHHIITSGPPVHCKPRQLLDPKLKVAKAEYQALLQLGIIRPSSSPYASPLHMATSKSGKLRPTGDYRALNAQTLPDRYPLPRIVDLLRQLHGCTIFSVIDLRKAFFQIPVAEEDIPKTAVTTPFGLFEFLGMPLGLRNATQTFMRYMNSILGHLDFVHIYLDDLLIGSNSEQQHLEHLRSVFDVLLDNKLKINWDKCQFAQPQVTFLGHIVNAEGFSVPTDRAQAMTDYPTPVTVYDLRRFLGAINYFRTMIPHAAHAQAALHELTKGNKKKDKTKLQWSPSLLQAFQLCKSALVDAVTLSYLQPGAPIILTADASATAIGGTLEQLVDGIRKPLGFFSRKLSATEQKYSPYDRELLAAFATLKNFAHIVEGREFIIRTDHKPLVKAFQQRPEKASPRQMQQLDYISQFCATFVHIPGDENVVADALSRIFAINMPTQLDPATIQQAQQQQDAMPPPGSASSLNLQKLSIDNSKIFCDISTGTVRPYLPPALRKTAFDIVHNLSHPSGRITCRTLKEKFIWPGIRRDALRWARECLACQRAKIHRHTRTQPHHIDVPEARFNHLHLDLITMPSVQDFRYCLTIIDRFSRWPQAIPLKDMQADTVASAFYSGWISLFGTPLTITTDQGTQFESALFSSLAKIIGAKKIHTTPYHPQANGMVERWHRTLKAALMCNPNIPWTQLLPTVLLGLRTSYKEDLGASPSELLFGTTLRVPGDFFTTQDQQVHPVTFLERLRHHFSVLQPTPTSHHTIAKQFMHKDMNTCTHVFKLVTAIKPPLTQPYTGPHKVVQRLDNKRFIIDVDGTHKTVSTDHLRPAYMAKDPSQQTAPSAHQPSTAQQPSQPNEPAQQRTRPRVTFQLPEDAAASQQTLPLPSPSVTGPAASSGPPSHQVSSRGGVVVAPLPHSAQQPSGLPRQAAQTPFNVRTRMRKQTLQPRAIFQLQPTPSTGRRP